jgi:hypothetical protein
MHINILIIKILYKLALKYYLKFTSPSTCSNTHKPPRDYTNSPILQKPMVPRLRCRLLYSVYTRIQQMCLYLFSAVLNLVLSTTLVLVRRSVRVSTKPTGVMSVSIPPFLEDGNIFQNSASMVRILLQFHTVPRRPFFD